MATRRPSPSIVGSSGTGSGPRRPVLATLLLMIGGLVGAACVGESPEVTVDDPELVSGRTVYSSNCASCHGGAGGGGTGPRLNEGAVTAAYPDIEDQIDLVANGKNAMPAYVGRLSDEQIRAVVRYTREVL